MTRNRDRLIDKKIGSVIRMQRVKLRMSQSDLGNSLGVTFQQIQKYENGGNAVASTRIPALCQTLEISPNDLFGVSARMDGELSQLELLGYEDGAQKRSCRRRCGKRSMDCLMRCRSGELKCRGSIAAKCWRRLHGKELDMTPSQFRQALETLAFTDGSRMAVQLASGQTISGRFQTMLTNGDMVWFTEERGDGPNLLALPSRGGEIVSGNLAML